MALPPKELAGIVTALSTTPVKGLRLNARSEVRLTEVGAADDRCFYLIDERSRLVNGKRIGALSAVRADYDAEAGGLSLTFPDGSEVTGEVVCGRRVTTRFFSRTPSAELVLGPFSDALSQYTGRTLSLVRADPELQAVDRGPRGGVSLISQASVRHLSDLAAEPIDPRRFRMLIEVTGLGPHEEDGLVGAQARVGEVLVQMHGHVGRCLVTTQNPETGEVDLPTLELLSYRRGLETTEPLAFGVFGEVLEPGTVRIGDELRSVPGRGGRTAGGR